MPVLVLEHIGRENDLEMQEWSRVEAALFSGSYAQSTERPFNRRPWVAEVTGPNGRFFFERRFVEGKVDYERSSGTGNRGVFLCFILREGRLYDVRCFDTWTSEDRYYCTVEQGEIMRLTEEEVEECLKSRSE